MRIFSILFIAVFFIGCFENTKTNKNPLEFSSFNEIEKIAKNSKVSIYMWGGSKEVNDYFDFFVIPKVKKLYDITLQRVPVNDIKTVVQKLDLENKSNRKSSTDILWINGENFKLAKEKSLLFGPFVQKLPNYKKFVDEKNLSNQFDFSEAIEGLESPFGKSQLVMVYNSKSVQTPPRSYKELFTWIKDNPNRFTYPALPDFTSSAFIRNLFIDFLGGIENFDKKTYKEEFEVFLKELDKIKPYMYQKGEFYPNSSALLDTLYTKGSVDFTFSYNPSHALNKIKNAEFPSSSKTVVFDKGTLANTHFLAIAKNAQNPSGAMVVINYLLSAKAQLQKAKSSVWGDGTVLDISKLDDLSKKEFLKLTNHPSILSSSELNQKQIPELEAKIAEVIEKMWIKNAQR